MRNEKQENGVIYKGEEARIRKSSWLGKGDIALRVNEK